MPRNGFLMPTAKKGFHILNLHPEKYILKINFFSCQFTRKIPNFDIVTQSYHVKVLKSYRRAKK